MTAKLFVRVVKRRLLRRLKIKRPHLFTENGACRMILHMDNARPHSAHLTRIQLQMQGIETLPHSPYSPDIAPCDFWLFGILKSSLRGRSFDTDEELMAAARGVVNQLPKSDYKNCYDQWIRRWRRVIDANGAYLNRE